MEENLIPFLGYWMDEKTKDDLLLELRKNILDRYDNEEHWDKDIIDNFVAKHNLSLLY